MKNKKILIGIVSFLALGASTLGVVVGQSANVPIANGSQAVYSMTLNNINKVTSAEATAKSFTRQTALGNNISFALSNFNYRSEAEYFGQISSGDTDRWIRNSSAMNGISKITINYDIKASGGSFKVGGSSSYGSYADYQTYSADAESNKTKVFTFETPVAYFSIENNTSKCGLYIRSLTVEYSCVAPSVEVEEKNSKDLLYYSTDEYDNFNYPGFSEDMRCTTETEKGSGYSAYFHCDANINISKNKVGKAREDNYPEALIRFNEPQDMSAVKLNISAKFNNAHRWFAITLYNVDQEAVTNEIGIDFVGSADEWLKYTINRATLFSSLVSGKSLENVQFMKVIMNFDSRDSASIQNNLPRNVWIDNIVIEEESNTIEINAGDTKTIVAGPTTFRAASQDKVDGKCLYMKFKYEGGSTSSDKVSFSLQNNPTSGGWHNVSGDLDIYGDMTTNKNNSGVIEDLGDGWKSLTMPTAYFNGNGDDRSAINLIYFKKFTGSVTKFTLNTDSVTFIDAPRDFTTTGKVVRFSSSIANWKTSGVKVVMDIEKIPGDKGGERNTFSLINSSSQTVASFTCRPVSHKLKQWNGSSEGSELPSTSSFVQKAGDIYTVTLVLNDINAMSGFDGSESVDRIEFSTYWSSFRIHSINVIR